jgi:hypothetical protein
MIKRMIKPQPTSITQNLVRQRFGDERFQRLPADALASGLPSAASSMPETNAASRLRGSKTLTTS